MSKTRMRLPHVAPVALRGIPFTAFRLSHVAPVALRGIPFTAFRLPRVAPLALCGIPFTAFRLPPSRELCYYCMRMTFNACSYRFTYFYWPIFLGGKWAAFG